MPVGRWRSIPLQEAKILRTYWTDGQCKVRWDTPRYQYLQVLHVE